jgi:hypothetical protein
MPNLEGGQRPLFSREHPTKPLSTGNFQLDIAAWQTHMLRCSITGQREDIMTQTDCERAQVEIDQLLNDPETPISPQRIWALAEAIAAAGCETGD